MAPPRKGLSRQRAQDERTEVLHGILQRHVSGASMQTVVVMREQFHLFWVAVRHFKTWGRALAAAGVDVEAIFQRRTWTPQRIILCIHTLRCHGLPLNHAAVTRIDNGMVHAARKRFGSWRAALSAAGFDPATVWKVRPRRTKSEIIATIQERAAAGAPLTVNGMSLNSMRYAIHQLFGSFNAALRAAGIGRPAEVPWSRTRISRAIREQHEAGCPLCCRGVLDRCPALYSAARHHYGSWDAALRAAGCDPRQVRRRRQPWDAKSLLAELRRRSQVNRPAPKLNAVDPVSLVHASKRLFGSLEAAARAAGVDPARIAHRPGRGHRKKREIVGT